MATAIENIEHHIKHFKKELKEAQNEGDLYEEVKRLSQISLAELCIAYIKEETEEVENDQ